MRMPPPTNKEDVTMEMVMGSLPDIQKSCLQMTITWHLSRLQPDMVSEIKKGEITVGGQVSCEGLGVFRLESDSFHLRYL